MLMLVVTVTAAEAMIPCLQLHKLTVRTPFVLAERLPASRSCSLHFRAPSDCLFTTDMIPWKAGVASASAWLRCCAARRLPMLLACCTTRPCMGREGTTLRLL